MAQNGVEASTANCVECDLTVGLQECHPSFGVNRQALETLAGFVQHRGRRIEQRHVVTGLGQRKRLMTCAAADIEHGYRWGWEVLEEMLVHHIGAHVPLH